MLEALEPFIVQALMALGTAATAWAVQWFRARTQRLVVEQATIEAESMGHRTGAKGVEKRDFALTLSATRLNSLTRPSPERLEELVEKAVPGARRSVPPPKDG